MEERFQRGFGEPVNNSDENIATERVTATAPATEAGPDDQLVGRVDKQQAQSATKAGEAG